MTVRNIIVEALLPARVYFLDVTSHAQEIFSNVQSILQPAPGFFEVKPAAIDYSKSTKHQCFLMFHLCFHAC
jgi:hypothetical protein